MKKVITLSLAVLIVCAFSVASAKADMMMKKDAPAATTVKATATVDTKAVKAVEVGNTVCPVSGDKIDPKSKATLEYNGKIYNFCCPKCIPVFQKDPEKYIKKIEEEMKAKVQPVK